MQPDKICMACGRPMAYRKKWAANWESVKFCSKGCRAVGTPTVLMADILSLLARRDPGKTICPSEILDDGKKKSRPHMERVRDAARLLAHEGKIVISQKGRAVDPSNFKGPIRLGLAKS